MTQIKRFDLSLFHVLFILHEDGNVDDVALKQYDYKLLLFLRVQIEDAVIILWTSGSFCIWCISLRLLSRSWLNNRYLLWNAAIIYEKILNLLVVTFYMMKLNMVTNICLYFSCMIWGTCPTSF